jgi:hypothetical protein
VPERHPHAAFDQGQHGNAVSGLTLELFFQAIRIQAFAISRQRAVMASRQG